VSNCRFGLPERGRESSMFDHASDTYTATKTVVLLATLKRCSLTHEGLTKSVLTPCFSSRYDTLWAIIGFE
jgi:hypothetical protein